MSNVITVTYQAPDDNTAIIAILQFNSIRKGDFTALDNFPPARKQFLLDHRGKWSCRASPGERDGQVDVVLVFNTDALADQFLAVDANGP